MNLPNSRRLEALEKAISMTNCPRLLIVRFIGPAAEKSDLCGIRAAPPHFPEQVDKLPNECSQAFVDRLHSRLLHLPAGKMVCVFER